MSVRRKVLGQRLLAELREELLSPAAQAELQAEMRRMLMSHRTESEAPQGAAQRRLNGLNAEVGRLIDALVAMGVSPAIQERLRVAEREKASIEAAMAINAESPALPASTTC